MIMGQLRISDMRPIKRIYCRECGRSKLLFESEKKALTFIRFNADEIEVENGHKPVRAYYCECCGGWHTTSMKKRPYNLTRLENVIETYEALSR